MSKLIAFIIKQQVFFTKTINIWDVTCVSTESYEIEAKQYRVTLSCFKK